MRNDSLVSIVLPTYNGEKYIKEAIDAIINQTYQNWELIVVNDCSTDSTPEIVKEYIKKDSRIRTINNDVNKKVPASLNIGFKEAKGEYFTWTSDDNYYYPNAIEKMVDFLENNNSYGMVYAVCEIAGHNKNPYWGEIPATPENLLNFSVCGACFLYRRSVADDIGEYDINTFLAEDHDYWLRIKLKYDIANISDILYKYRLHDNSLTSMNKNKARLKGIDLAIKYSDEYLKVFPDLKNYINTKISIWKFLRNINRKDFKQLVKLFNKNILYKELKYFYNIDGNKAYLDSIMKLGPKYFIKGIILFLKWRKN